MDLGVVILAYARGDEHVGLLADLAAAGVDGARIVVVHNPDRPGDDAFRPTIPAGGTLLRSARNVGYAAGMNRGLEHHRAARRDVVLLLTHDVRLDPGAVAEVVAVAGAEPTAAVVGPAVRGAGGAAISYGSRMGADGLVRHLTARPGPGRVADVPWVDGCAMLVRLAAVLRDPLPERFFLYFEEPELCSSVREAGWRVLCAQEATASSVSGIGGRRPLFLYLYARNGVAWSARHRGRRRTARLVLGELGRGWSLLPGPRAGSRAWRDGGRMLVARVFGLVDAGRGRFGPPPAWLLRGSDVGDV